MTAVSPFEPLRGALRANEPMSAHTSWRAGGPAERFYVPADARDLAEYLSRLPSDEPVLWAGLGSNLLVRDGGVRGSVIMTAGALNGLALAPDGSVRAEAGVPGAKLARFAVRQGLRGAEFLAGIPGTVGGALAMNAGAFGGETWPLIEAVETLDRRGRVRRRPAADFRIGYRSVEGPEDEGFLAGHFRLRAGDAAEGQAQIKRLLAQRGTTQPTQWPNAGSVFRNPPGDHAARLIESAGLKGTREGRACVSTLHANFIINEGGARAADIERLIARVEETVAAVYGVHLVREVRIVGEAA